MQCRLDIAGNAMVAYLDGEIDHHTSKDIREQIDKSIDQNTPEMLIIDFKDVTFMDSSGIGLVMGRYKKIQPLGGKVQIQNPSPNIKKVLKLAGMDRLAKL